jgi:1,4-alpha-glucan branching enzyme
LLQILKDDPYLQSFGDVYYRLREKMKGVVGSFEHEGGLDGISQSYSKWGLHEVAGTPNTYLYREWAPAIKELSIFGDFNNWNRTQYQATRVPPS